MFVNLWLFFLATGTFMAVFVLLWSMKTHQFEDQERARYLPLVGLTAEELGQEPPPRGKAALYGMAMIVLCGMLVLGSTLFVVFKLS